MKPRTQKSLHAGCRSTMRVWLAASVVAVVVDGCGDDFNEAQDLARLEEMRHGILEAVGEADCTDSSECAFIGLGSKPCGGPWEFVVYSRSSVDEDDLRALVTSYNRFNDVVNKRYGYISDCSLPEAPETGCADGRCVDLNRVSLGGTNP